MIKEHPRRELVRAASRLTTIRHSSPRIALTMSPLVQHCAIGDAGSLLRQGRGRFRGTAVNAHAGAGQHAVVKCCPAPQWTIFTDIGAGNVRLRLEHRPGSQSFRDFTGRRGVLMIA